MSMADFNDFQETNLARAKAAHLARKRARAKAMGRDPSTNRPFTPNAAANANANPNFNANAFANANANASANQGPSDGQSCDLKGNPLCESCDDDAKNSSANARKYLKDDPCWEIYRFVEECMSRNSNQMGSCMKEWMKLGACRRKQSHARLGIQPMVDPRKKWRPDYYVDE